MSSDELSVRLASGTHLYSPEVVLNEARLGDTALKYCNIFRLYCDIICIYF